MEFLKILEGVISSLSAAVLLAALAWLFSWVRNQRLEAKLQEGLSPNGVGIGYNPTTREGSFSLQIHNWSHVGVQIREVILQGAEGQGHLVMEYDSKRGLEHTPLLNEVFQPQFQRVHLAKGFTYGEANEKSVALPPKTMGIWKAPPSQLGVRKWFIRELIVVVEYPTIFGYSALVKLDVPPKMLKMVRDNFSNVCRSCRENVPIELPPYVKQ